MDRSLLHKELSQNSSISSTARDYEYLLEYNYENEVILQNSAFDVATLVLYGIAIAFGIPGNVIVIWVMGYKLKRTVTTLWFLNMAAADLLETIFLPLPFAYLLLGNWMFGRWLCKLTFSLGMLTMFASVFFLVVITLDRHLSIAHPAIWHKHRTIKAAFCTCLIVWIMALALALPYFYYQDTITLFSVTSCLSHVSSHEEDMALLLTAFLAGFAIPLVLLIICSALLIINVKKDLLVAQRKLYITITAVVLSFFICWAPYHVTCILKLFLHSFMETDTLNSWSSVAVGISYLHSCLNPILYLLIGHSFRNYMQKSILEIMRPLFQEGYNSRLPGGRQSENEVVVVTQLESLQ
ncbi:G-protein coupled receptor 1-like [Protopterus annectens]|uniref:G-protein coupled receptor 1-like n=1 Tax=Protopterus annectens TaxID=7888 RepID=UPI001CFA152D|nr:G-protein coupled receptor 1-like [Protopterus annectens]